MNKCFTDEGWRDYIYWQREDKKTLKRINDLLKDIERNGVSDGIGKPEKLIADFSGYWSRRIDQKNRLIEYVAKFAPLPSLNVVPPKSLKSATCVVSFCATRKGIITIPFPSV